MNHTMKSCEAQYIAKDISLRKLYFYDYEPKQEADISKTNFLERACNLKSYLISG